MNNKNKMSFVASPLTDEASELIEMIDVDKIIEIYKNSLGIDILDQCVGYTKVGFYKCRTSGLKFFHPMITGDDSFYKKLQAFPWYYQDEKKEWEFAKGYTRNKSIVEIGCGEGKFATHAEAAHYVGLELNGNAVKVAKDKGMDVREQLSSVHVQERSEYYDVVCAFQVLEHVGDINSFVMDSVKLCRPGGVIIFSVPAEDGFVGLASNNVLNMPPHHVSRWTDESLVYLSRKYKLELLDIHKDKFDMIHYEWYAHTLGCVVLRALLNKNKVPLIVTGLLDKAVEKMGRVIGRKLVANGCLRKILPAGHSVTAIYRK